MLRHDRGITLESRGNFLAIAYYCLHLYISVTIRNQTYACGTGTRQLGGLGLGRSVAENGCVQMRVGHLTKGLFNLFARLLRRLRHTAAQLLSAHASHCLSLIHI